MSILNRNFCTCGNECCTCGKPLCLTKDVFNCISIVPKDHNDCEIDFTDIDIITFSITCPCCENVLLVDGTFEVNKCDICITPDNDLLLLVPDGQYDYSILFHVISLDKTFMYDCGKIIVNSV